MALFQVAGLASVWAGQTVVATEPLGDDLTAALLAAGARAVIARRPDQPDPSAQHAVAFFQELYEHLLTGRTLVEVRWALLIGGKILIHSSDSRNLSCRTFVLFIGTFHPPWHVNDCRRWRWLSDSVRRWLVHINAYSPVSKIAGRQQQVIAACRSGAHIGSTAAERGTMHLSLR